MKKRKVIKNMPIKMPIAHTVLYTFLMDYYNASGVLWGIYLTLAVIIWVVVFIGIYNQEQIDVFNHKAKEEFNKERKSFQERIKDKMEEAKNEQ